MIQHQLPSEYSENVGETQGFNYNGHNNTSLVNAIPSRRIHVNGVAALPVPEVAILQAKVDQHIVTKKTSQISGHMLGRTAASAKRHRTGYTSCQAAERRNSQRIQAGGFQCPEGEAAEKIDNPKTADGTDVLLARREASKIQVAAD